MVRLTLRNPLPINRTVSHIVVDARYDSETWRKLYQVQLNDRLRSAAYEVVANDDGVTLYRLRK